MCDATLIASAVLTGGSMAANSAAQSQVTNARNRALEAERQRQAGYQQQADALNEKSRKSYDGFGAGQDQRASQLASLFTGSNGQPAAAAGAGQPTETAPGTTSNIVQQEQAKQSGKAKAYTDQQGQALGKLRSFGDYLGTLSREQARDAGQIGQLGNFMQGSSGALPLELDAASHAGDGLKTVADLARFGGQLGMTSMLTRNIAPDPKPLPSMANVPAVGTQTAEGLAAALPKQPMQLNLPNAYLPAFSRLGALYGGI